MTDRYGQEIEPGVFVTYPVRHGSFMEMVTAQVTAVVRKENPYGREGTHPALIVKAPGQRWKGVELIKSDTLRTIECLHRVTVVPSMEVNDGYTE